MSEQLATSETILVSAAGVIAADSAGLSSVKSYSALLTSIAALPLAGGTLTGNLLFTDNTYTIGAAGATRPSAVHVGTGGVTSAGIVLGTSPAQFTSGFCAKGPEIDNNCGGGIDFTANSGTVYGYIRSDNTTLYQTTTRFAGDISMSKTSAQGYLNLYSSDGTKLLYLYANNSGTGVMVATTNIQMSSASGSVSATNNQIALSPTSGNAYVYVSGTNSTFDVWDSTGIKCSRLTHDSTNGSLSTSSGNLNLTPAGGTVAVTGGITASGVVSHGAYTVATLPSAASNAGKNAQVTDSNVAASGNYGATVAAGGANRVKVFSDGTNWVIA